VRLIKQGGLMVNDIKSSDPDAKLKKGDYLFKAGKRKFLRVVGR